MKIVTFNLCLGLFKKKDFVVKLLEIENIDVCCLQETELTINQVQFMQIHNYVLLTEISSKTIRTAIYIKKSVKFTRRSDLEKEDRHIMVVDLEDFRLISLYRAFKNNLQEGAKTFFEEQLKLVEGNLKEQTLVLGDFNVDYNKIFSENYHQRREADLLLEWKTNNHLIQLVEFPTWRRIIQSKLVESCLDHCYTMDPTIIESVGNAHVIISDHVPVIISTKNKKHVKWEIKCVRNWRKYDPDGWCEELSKENWDIQHALVDDFSEELEQKIKTALERHLPLIEREVRGNWKNQSLAMQSLLKKKKTFLKNARRRGTVREWEKVKELSRNIRRQVRMEERKRVRDKIDPKKPSSLWDAVKVARGTGPASLPSQMFYNSEKIAEKEEANVFADFFRKKAQLQRYTKDEQKDVDKEEDQCFMTAGEVRKAIESLPKKKCYGFDHIPCNIISDGISILLEPVTRLMKKIYEQKKVPNQWKIARITPLHKKGPKNEVTNYRPISNLCSMSKVFERLLLQRMNGLELLRGDSLSGNSQHGFKKDRSTVTAMIELQAKVADALDKNKHLACASLDLSAAFDLVPIENLMIRLQNTWLPRDVCKLIEAWLTGRQAYVEADGMNSLIFDLECGTVQGSILGPVLYSIYVEPIMRQTDRLGYADDSYITAAGAERDLVMIELEKKIEEVVGWMESSGMMINYEKTEFIMFSNQDFRPIKLKVGSETVQSKDSIKVLGVMFDKKLNWSEQVKKAISAASVAFSGLKLIRRHFTRMETMNLITAFVYTKLYYGAMVWLNESMKTREWNALFSFSGRVLGLVDPSVMNYEERHKLCERATPKQWSTYNTCLLLKYVHDVQLPDIEWLRMQDNMLHSTRSQCFLFTSSNQRRVGKNLPSNRFKYISNMLNYSSLNLTKNSFKVHLKKLIFMGK